MALCTAASANVSCVPLQYVLPLPARRLLQVLRKQREKDEELARAKAERDAEAARRALERKLQLQDKVG